jgi:hypothetical protein
MNSTMPLEDRVRVLIEAYAERAPTDVDPMAVTRLAAAGRRERAAVLPRFGPTGLRLGFALLVVVLLVMIVGTVFIAGGMPHLRDREGDPIERGFVEPFLGLPAAGAMPSTPETGELVFSFDGRVDNLGGDFYRMWVYADGRLIWKSNLEGSGRANPAFGASGPTTAVIEQRLTPLGVELLRSEVMSTARILSPARVGEDLTEWRRPGVIWGGMAIGAGDQILAATWSDPRLPGRLADPGSWLPASAWADQRIGGFVPARYAVCSWQLDGHPPVAQSQLEEALGMRTKDELLSRSTPRADPSRPECSLEVATEDARAIVEAVDAAGLRPDRGTPLRYSFPMGGVLELLPILPNGDTVCNCG